MLARARFFLWTLFKDPDPLPTNTYGLEVLIWRPLWALFASPCTVSTSVATTALYVRHIPRASMPGVHFRGVGTCLFGHALCWSCLYPVIPIACGTRRYSLNHREATKQALLIENTFVKFVDGKLAEGETFPRDGIPVISARAKCLH